ncbi:MAG: enoyl-CoA hydratase/isomerase family protein [Actinobacteria bacterium]|nr:MAG: enoyl-CoA hydratase/isomerase family protein [Actinomycetota bacterium]
MPALVLVSDPADGVATLTLNRPEKKNALSIAVRDEFTDALDALARDDAVKVVVVTGAGDTFSAGFDLREFDRLDDEAFAATLWASSDRWHRGCIEFPLPMLAAVNGPALAGGLDLAVMCDVRVAADTARFSHPEITFGDVVYGPLHDIVGGAVARDLCFTGRAVDASEALRLHLVSAVVPAAELLAEAGRFAAQIARAPRDVLVRTKAKALRRSGITAGATLDL